MKHKTNNLLVAAIAPADKSRVRKIREQMPSLKHRKTNIFAK